MRHGPYPPANPRSRVVACGLASSLVLLLLATAAIAAPQTQSPSGRATFVPDHARRQYLDPARRPLQRNPQELAAQTDAALLADAATARRRERLAAKTQDCLAALAAASVAEVVGLLRAADPGTCLYDIFFIRENQAGATFTAAKMIRVAEALADDGAQYPGDNRLGTLQLILFLRAGYYVRFHQSAHVADFGPGLAAAVARASDALLAQASLSANNESNGRVRSEFLILQDSALDKPRLAAVMLRFLADYDLAGYRVNGSMEGALFAVFYNLFRNAGTDDFAAVVRQRPELLEAVHGFIVANDALIGDRSRRYLLRAAVGELARFTDARYAAEPRERVRTMLRGLLQRYPRNGAGGALWVKIAEHLDYYDPGQCAGYATCNWRSEVIAALFPPAADCNPALRLRAMRLDAGERAGVCDDLAGMTEYFHERLQTRAQPLPGDHNETLELIVFASQFDYAGYADALFGIDTNNGGIYIEGDPGRSDNQARLFVYEIGAPGQPDWAILNLLHEYVHYLDGRFDLAGGFCDAPLGGLCDSAGFTGPSGSAVWYIEGLAEYLAYSYDARPYPRAIDEGRTRRHRLHEVFDTRYGDGQGRIYGWGYLAMHYLFDRQPARLAELLAIFREGRARTAYPAWQADIGTQLDRDFELWVQCFVDRNGDATGCNPERVFGSGFEALPPLPECAFTDDRVLGHGCRRSGLASMHGLHFYVIVPAGVSRIVVESEGGSGNADMYAQQDAFAYPNAFQLASTGPGNRERIVYERPAAGHYFFVHLHAAAPFADVEIRLRYE